MKKLVSGLIACVMLFSLASCDLGGSGKDKRDREKSDDIKTEKELEETETETTVTSETEERVEETMLISGAVILILTPSAVISLKN